MLLLGANRSSLVLGSVCSLYSYGVFADAAGPVAAVDGRQRRPHSTSPASGTRSRTRAPADRDPTGPGPRASSAPPALDRHHLGWVSDVPLQFFSLAGGPLADLGELSPRQWSQWSSAELYHHVETVLLRAEKLPCKMVDIVFRNGAATSTPVILPRRERDVSRNLSAVKASLRSPGSCGPNLHPQHQSLT